MSGNPQPKPWSGVHVEYEGIKIKAGDDYLEVTFRDGTKKKFELEDGEEES